MDEIIKLLQKLLAESPKPKGGIASSQQGIEFLGKALTKEQRGNLMIVNSRLTDASRFIPFSIRNVGRDKRYRYIFEYEQDLTGEFNKTIEFLKDNPEIRLTQTQKDNIFYNLGVYRRVTEEKNKLEKGIISEGKKPEEVYSGEIDKEPIDELSFGAALEKLLKTNEKLKDATKKLEEGFEKDVNYALEVENKLRLKKLYDGPGYNSPNEGNYRGYGSFFLPKLHDKGIIKLDDKIYDNLVKGKHHHGGADFFAPDPIRIWRKHFGNDVFKKLDNFDPDNEDIFQWIERNNVKPIQKEGPKNALEYKTSIELQQNLTDELSVFGKYKNPEGQGGFFEQASASERLERLGYHGENINALETALQTLDPDSFREYARTKPKFDSKILPFKDLNAEGGRVGFDNGGGIFSINPDEAVKFNLDGEIINLNPKFFEMFMGPFMDDPKKFKRRIDDLKQEIRRNQKTVALAEGGIVGLRI